MLSSLAPTAPTTSTPNPPRVSDAPSPAPPADVFTLDSPDKAIAFPALNPLLFETLKFGVEIASVTSSGISAPLHLSDGQPDGDVTYTLGFNSNQLEGRGSIGGQSFDETWTLGPTLKIDGKLGDVEEHLSATHTGQQWHITGSVGQYPVTQDTTEWDKGTTQGYNVDTTVGDRKTHAEYTQTHAGADGKWTVAMQSADANAQGQFAALQDRQRFSSSGQNGSAAWTAAGDILYPDNPNTPPPSSD